MVSQANEKLSELVVASLMFEPGLSARELSKKIGFSKTEINSILYSGKDLFESVGDSPPRWKVQDSTKNLRDDFVEGPFPIYGGRSRLRDPK